MIVAGNYGVDDQLCMAAAGHTFVTFLLFMDASILGTNQSGGYLQFLVNITPILLNKSLQQSIASKFVRNVFILSK